MVSLRDLLPFSAKVCVMKRVRSDGSVELYCERPSNANASRDDCVECLSVEDCRDIYGLDSTTIFTTNERDYYKVDGQLYSRPSQEPSCSSQPSDGSSNEAPTRNQTSHPSAPVHSGNRYHNHSVRISHSGNTRHTERNSSRLTNNGLIVNGHGNMVNLRSDRNNLIYSGNVASTYREDRPHSATQDHRSSSGLEERTRSRTRPREHTRERSDFSAAEQAAWEERFWRKLQEEEYVRDRSPSPCYDYKDDRDDRDNRDDRDDCGQQAERSRSRRREHSRGRSSTVYYDCEDERDVHEGLFTYTPRRRSPSTNYNYRDEGSRSRRREYSRGRSTSPYDYHEADRYERDDRDELPSRRRQRSESIEVLDARFIFAGSGEYQDGEFVFAQQRNREGDRGFVYIGEGGYDSDGREYSL